MLWVLRLSMAAPTLVNHLARAHRDGHRPGAARPDPAAVRHARDRPCHRRARVDQRHTTCRFRRHRRRQGADHQERPVRLVPVPTAVVLFAPNPASPLVVVLKILVFLRGRRFLEDRCVSGRWFRTH